MTRSSGTGLDDWSGDPPSLSLSAPAVATSFPLIDSKTRENEGNGAEEWAHRPDRFILNFDSDMCVVWVDLCLGCVGVGV